MKQPAKNPPFSDAGFMDFVGIYKRTASLPQGETLLSSREAAIIS